MFSIAIVIFREFLEIALLLGIIMAVTKDIAKSRHYIIAGAMAGVMCASFFAFFAKYISVYFGGMGDEIFDSGVILLTVFVISWTVIWMQGYGSKVRKNFADLSARIHSGRSSHMMLSLVVATTVMREGTEIVLFVYSISSAQNIAIQDYILGLAIGSISGLLVGVTIYWGLIRLLSKYIFKLSSTLLILIASGLAADAAGILTSSGVINVLSDELWDSSWIAEDRSVLGEILNTIIGYTARPNGMQLLFYLGTIVMITICIKLKDKNH